MLTDLITQLIKTIHDFVSKAGSTTDIADLAVTAEDVVTTIPEVLAPNVGLAVDAVNAVIDIAKAATPATASPAVTEAITIATDVAGTIAATDATAPVAAPAAAS